LAIGVRAADGNFYKPIPSYAAGNIRHPRNPSVGNGEWIACGRLTTSGLTSYTPSYGVWANAVPTNPIDAIKL
jgi:hypothetical protein